jgi:hypothetical protein
MVWSIVLRDRSISRSRARSCCSASRTPQRRRTCGVAGEPLRPIEVLSGVRAWFARVQVHRAHAFSCTISGTDNDRVAPSDCPRLLNSGHRVSASMSSTITTSPSRRHLRRGPSSTS